LNGLCLPSGNDGQIQSNLVARSWDVVGNGKSIVERYINQFYGERAPAKLYEWLFYTDVRRNARVSCNSRPLNSNRTAGGGILGNGEGEPCNQGSDESEEAAWLNKSEGRLLDCCPKGLRDFVEHLFCSVD
jgi:hypothetical protein